MLFVLVLQKVRPHAVALREVVMRCYVHNNLAHLVHIAEQRFVATHRTPP